MNRHPLISYLNDHLAGSTAAVHLLEHLTGLHKESPRETFFAGLLAETEDDRAILRRLIREVGGGAGRGRSAATWVAEKLLDVRLYTFDPKGPLHVFEALETLALGIEGKRSLWRALRAAGECVPQICALSLDALERRAEDQSARVERLRLELASQALSAVA